MTRKEKCHDLALELKRTKLVAEDVLCIECAVAAGYELGASDMAQAAKAAVRRARENLHRLQWPKGGGQ